MKPGDILVGKITPKGETQLSPEEKLLRAIFGEKAGEVRDTSLRVPPGVEGTVINARVFSRKGVSQGRAQPPHRGGGGRRKLSKDQQDEIRIIRDRPCKQGEEAAGRQATTGSRVADDEPRKVLLAKGAEITAEDLDADPVEPTGATSRSATTKVEDELSRVGRGACSEQIDAASSTSFQEKIERLKGGDELPPGVIKMVKVFVAIKRKLQVGDKMAGRHGNKGVLSRILPEEDMPYLADGTPVDIVLNPLGVPSRMNVGQILETHLGWAARELRRQLEPSSRATDGRGVDERAPQDSKDIYGAKDIGEFIDDLRDDDVREARAQGVTRHPRRVAGVRRRDRGGDLRAARSGPVCPPNGQTRARSTAAPASRSRSEVTVGVMYMMKLHHLVDDKIHARSTGPYSLVTQQPLGGKAQFGGQRLGEMEVWALEALRRGVQPAGDADGQVRRRRGSHPHVRGASSRARTCSSPACPSRSTSW